MRIPKKVKIGGHIVKVIMQDMGGHLDGEADTHANSICIEDKLPQSQKECTLIHEALHMMNSTWGESREGHTLLESISQQVYQFLSDNHLLAK